MSREEAFAAERKIKGWSWAKKEALIKGQGELVSQLACGDRPHGAGVGAWPSTSSG